MSKLNAENRYKNRAVLYCTKGMIECFSLEDRNDFMLFPMPTCSGSKNGKVVVYRPGLVSKPRGKVAAIKYVGKAQQSEATELGKMARDQCLLELDRKGLLVIVDMEVYRSRNNLRRIMNELFNTLSIGNLNLRKCKVSASTVDAVSKKIIAMIADSDKKHRKLPKHLREKPHDEWIKPVKKRVKAK